MTKISITEERVRRCKVFNRNNQKVKKSPTRRADGGKQIKTDAIIQRVRQFMNNSVT